ncbi:glutathione S-transferase N-terminal domain-containing protein, partial [Alishewanella longhuensis]
MAIIANKRPVMTLFSAVDDMFSHQVRIVLAEKGVTVDILQVTPDNVPEDLYEVNPYGSLPTLLDRELALYQADIIMEYLDERFPHPPLMPVYPVARGQARLMMYRIKNDWYSLADKILQNHDDAALARQELKEGLLSIAPLFGETP